MRTPRGPIAGLLALMLVAGLAACGSDDDTSADTTTTEAADETTTTTEAATPETIEVTAVDYAFEGLPSTVAAGSTLTLTNTSTAELHELVAFLLPDTEERSVEEIAALPEAELGQLFAGEPAAVLLAAPGGGEQIAAVGDGSFTEPGRYVVFCFIPTGADPEEYLNAPPGDGPPEVEGGPPHFTEGMFGEFTVE
jgi:hypothetical protein